MTPWEEGREAAGRGVHFNQCPYLHNKPDRDVVKRGQWFAGWKERLDELGLGFTFDAKLRGKNPAARTKVVV